MKVCVKDGMVAQLGTGPGDARVYHGDFRYPEGHDKEGEREVVDLPEHVIYSAKGKPGSALMLPDGGEVPPMDEAKATAMHKKLDEARAKAAVDESRKPKKKGPPTATFATPQKAAAPTATT